MMHSSSLQPLLLLFYFVTSVLGFVSFPLEARQGACTSRCMCADSRGVSPRTTIIRYGRIDVDLYIGTTRRGRERYWVNSRDSFSPFRVTGTGRADGGWDLRMGIPEHHALGNEYIGGNRGVRFYWVVVDGANTIRLRGNILNECNMTFLSAHWGLPRADYDTIWIIGGSVRSPGTRVPIINLQLHWELIHEGI